MKLLYTCLVFFFLSFSVLGQVPEITPPEYIRTIQFKSAIESSGIPLIKWGQGFVFEFDDLVGDEADYYYKISYYNFDWTPTDLSKNEFLKGFDNLRIKSYKNSFNTLQIYTHYQLSLPNRDTEAFKLSGNYMLEIYDQDDQLVFSKPFIVYENLAPVETEIKRSRDLKYLNTNQVVNFAIQSDENLTLRNPDQTLEVVLFQNQNFRKTITGLKPQYRTGTKLVYRYDQEAAFAGGNEYLFFDSKDVRTTANNIEYTTLDNIYNLYIFTDLPRFNKPYTYNPDINGNYKINTVHGSDPKIESEYVWVHFALKDDEVAEGHEVHVFGGFNDYLIDNSTRLTYNPETESYQGKYLLKQGFYNYKYVLRNPDGTVDEGFFSGDFDKTENDYTVLVYYREPGARYDRLIGVGNANSQNMSN